MYSVAAICSIGREPSWDCERLPSFTVSFRKANTGSWVTAPSERDWKDWHISFKSKTQCDFVGELPRSQLLQKLAECDVLMHPSLHDSGGWVCLEAMAAGRPVLCLDLGGPALQVTEDTGIRLRSRSPMQAVEDLAAALMTLASDRTLCSAMGAAGRRRISEHFNWERKGLSMAKVYAAVVGVRASDDRRPACGSPSNDWINMDMKLKLRRFFDKHTDLREAVRYLLTRPGIHRGSTKNDILLLSSGRSGSTWLMEVIASEPGIRFVNEPLRPEYVAKLKLPTELDSLPADERKILGVPSPAEDRFRALFADYRMTRTFGPYDFFSPQFHWSTTRRIIKDVYAASIADWIQEQSFGFKTIYLIRHPIPTALSMSRGCTLRIEANLKHPTFAEKFLNQQLVEFSWWMLEHGSELEKRVLEWCLDNIVPWTIVKTRPRDWLVITYEELMLSPDRSLQLIADHLGLRHIERLRQAMTRPSASTHNSRVKRGSKL